MIEGLKITVPGTELKELCLKQSAHHKSRAEFYTKQRDTMAEVGITDENSLSNVSPKRQINDKVKEHMILADELKFIAEHLIESEQYLLDRGDLIRLGLGSRQFI